ncbi:MAG: LexA family transcriptional regulator [Deltaproteobacteria bacterium]|jgi:transcriptional regulator with XRE-family HTH domain|nr:LexA family transcriptional regulator [Deltaproteobacteria bacterium]
MKSIDKIFAETLKYFVQQERSQRSFAAKVGISAPYLNDLLNGRRYGEDQTKRKIASALGYPDRQYEDFLDIGRLIVNGDVSLDSEGQAVINEDVLRVRGFLPINYSERMLLGPDNVIQITEDYRHTHVVVHGPTLRRSTALGLQAFRVPDDGMEPIIPKNSLIVADLTVNNLDHIKEGQVYVVCLDRDSRQCFLKYLSWGEKDKLILACSENRKHRTVAAYVEDVTLVGRVIMGIRNF